MDRRTFLASGTAALAVSAGGCSARNRTQPLYRTNQPKERRILFSSRGEIGIINADGAGERYLDLREPGQKYWGPGPLFSDCRRLILISYEEGKMWEGNVRTRQWIYDLESDELKEMELKNRPAAQMPVAALLPGEKRMVLGPIIDREERVMVTNLDGTDPVEVTHKGEGFAYCANLSPDGKRIAFHITGEKPYRIMVSSIDGSRRTFIAEHPEHLYFGPVWSPDGKWLLYQDCHVLNERKEIVDPGHDWSDLCLGRPDGPKGPEHRVVTSGQSCWFAASYGNPLYKETVRSGSNLPAWSPDGSTVTYIRRIPGSQPPWIWANDRPDKDHFNRDFRPERSRGGTQICLLDPFTGKVSELTPPEPQRWDCYPVFSPDGKQMAFSRVWDGGVPELWIMNSDGGSPRFLTRGVGGMGAIYPRFLA